MAQGPTASLARVSIFKHPQWPSSSRHRLLPASSSSSHQSPCIRKVVIETTHGPLDIELWPKEAPKAGHNFVQLCLEGYELHLPLTRLYELKTNKSDRTFDPPPKITSLEVHDYVSSEFLVKLLTQRWMISIY